MVEAGAGVVVNRPLDGSSVDRCVIGRTPNRNKMVVDAAALSIIEPTTTVGVSLQSVVGVVLLQTTISKLALFFFY